jgi:hypothetical protein
MCWPNDAGAGTGMRGARPREVDQPVAADPCVNVVAAIGQQREWTPRTRWSCAWAMDAAPA